MIVERVTRLADTQFAKLFAYSLSYMDGGTFIWPRPMSGVEKREMIRARFETVIAAPDGLVTVIRTADRETDLMLTAGHLIHGTLHLAVSLLAPLNGSRAYAYAPAFTALWKHALAGYGVTRAVTVLPASSPLCETIKTCHGVTDGDFRPTGDADVATTLWGS